MPSLLQDQRISYFLQNCWEEAAGSGLMELGVRCLSGVFGLLASVTQVL